VTYLVPAEHPPEFLAQICDLLRTIDSGVGIRVLDGGIRHGNTGHIQRKVEDVASGIVEPARGGGARHEDT